jgi:hypothetical protein
MDSAIVIIMVAGQFLGYRSRTRSLPVQVSHPGGVDDNQQTACFIPMPH